MPSCGFILFYFIFKVKNAPEMDNILHIQVKCGHWYLPSLSQSVWCNIPSGGCSSGGNLLPQNHEDLINLAWLPDLVVAVLTLARPPATPFSHLLFSMRTIAPEMK